MSTDYSRTRISRIQCLGYRSLHELDLLEIPDLVVMHGPNGAGKSNILRVPWLAMHWASRRRELPTQRSSAWVLTYAEASDELHLRPDDFTKNGNLPEMRLTVELTLGSRAVKTIGGFRVGDSLHLQAVAQDTGEGRIKVWFPVAHCGGLSLGPKSPQSTSDRQELGRIRGLIDRNSRRLHDLNVQIKNDAANPSLDAQTEDKRGTRRRVSDQLSKLEMELARLESKLSQEELATDRLRHVFLAGRAMHRSIAYRMVSREDLSGAVHGRSDPETNSIGIQRILFEAMTSDDASERRGFRELVKRLESTNIFPGKNVSLEPIRNKKFDEYQLLVSASDSEALPLCNFGTGQQQFIILVAEAHIADCPILGIEEPEAHLHRELMEHLGEYLTKGVAFAGDGDECPAFDQLWLTTHNHQFALASTYLDVALSQNGTEAKWQPRPTAIEHFYEPGPAWEALRCLVDKALPEDSIVLHDENGIPIRATEILQSIDSDRELANKYARAVTEAVVMALEKSTKREA